MASALNSGSYTPNAVVVGISDNYSPVNKNTMRNSVGKEISLVQNYVNSKRLGYGELPIQTGYFVNVNLSGGDLNISRGTSASNIYLQCYSSTNSTGPNLYFYKSDSNTVGTKTTTDDGDLLGRINFYGVNGDSLFYKGSQISASQVGVAGADFVPSTLNFYTSTNIGTFEALQITESGNVWLVDDNRKLEFGGNEDDYSITYDGVRPRHVSSTYVMFSGCAYTVLGTSLSPTPTGSLWVGASGTDAGILFGIFNTQGAGPYCFIQARDNNGTSSYPLLLNPLGADAHVGINKKNPSCALDVSGLIACDELACDGEFGCNNVTPTGLASLLTVGTSLNEVLTWASGIQSIVQNFGFMSKT
jgi:hypothetical protein